MNIPGIDLKEFIQKGIYNNNNVVRNSKERMEDA